MSSTGIVDRGVKLGGGERDYNHVSDPEYKKLRDLADKAYKRRQELSNQSQQAYKQGDGQRAHELSEQAKKQVAIADEYNYKAAEYVFRENNADSDGDEIDLHGLYIREAIWILKKRIVAGVQRGESKLEVIVGKGLHSKGGVAKLKPAVEELCNEAGFKDHIDPKNAGVLVIDLSNARIPASWNNIEPLSGAPSKPSNSYQPQPQPQYNNQYQQQQQQQQQYQQYQQQPNNYNQQQNNNNNDNLLVKVLCFCFKQLTK